MSTPHEVTGPINLGNPTEITMLELASQIIELVGSDVGVERRPLPPDDPTQRQPDITYARATLDWSPRTGLDDGLAETVRHFRALLARESTSTDRE